MPIYYIQRTVDPMTGRVVWDVIEHVEGRSKDEWCQRYALRRDAKEGVAYLTVQASEKS